MSWVRRRGLGLGGSRSLRERAQSTEAGVARVRTSGIAVIVLRRYLAVG